MRKIFGYLFVAAISFFIGYFISFPKLCEQIPIRNTCSSEDIEFILNVNSYVPDNGFICDKKVAADIAKIIISSVYHEKFSKNSFFDVSLIGDSLWLVIGDENTVNNNEILLRGNPYVLMKKNGEIVKVIHSK